MDTNDAYRLANSLLREHGLDNWRFSFDRSLSRGGQCSHRNKSITLSRELTTRNDLQWVSNTILHEIAHALVGPGNGHNSIWQRKAIQIGCDGKRCHTGETPEYSHFIVCGYGCRIGRHRRTNISNRVCKRHQMPVKYA